MSAEQDLFPGDGTSPPAPIVLTTEELKVLKECRWNSIVYRGLPLGVISVTIAQAAVKAGYFRKYSGLYYTGMFSLAFFAGVGSYRNTCLQKIMALENSQLGTQLREYQKKVGIPVTEFPEKESTEFQDDTVSFTAPITLQDEVVTTGHDGGSQWDEIRKQSRQTHSSGERGLSYEELRRKNRANQLSPSMQIAPSDENQKKPMTPDFESFTSQTFNSDKLSGLDFSKDEDSKIFSFKDNSDADEVQKESDKPRRKYTRGVPYKNKYGDDVE